MSCVMIEITCGKEAFFVLKPVGAYLMRRHNLDGGLLSRLV